MSRSFIGLYLSVKYLLTVASARITETVRHTETFHTLFLVRCFLHLFLSTSSFLYFLSLRLFFLFLCYIIYIINKYKFFFNSPFLPLNCTLCLSLSFSFFFHYDFYFIFYLKFMISFSLSYIFNLFTFLSTILSLQLLLHLEYLTVLRSQNLLSLKTSFLSLLFSDSFKLLLPRISSSNISYFLL